MHPCHIRQPARLWGAIARVVAWVSVGVFPGIADLRAAATYEVLGSFQKPGNQVVAPLLAHSDGNFYGVASANGAYDLGTIFKLTPSGTLTTLHSFSGADGSGPTAKLVEGADQALYGTAASGGSGGFGTGFKITTAGAFTKLVDFTGTSGAAPGSVPHGLVLHADGNFYGVAQAGGVNGFGTVFRMTPAGTVTTLLNFTGTAGTRPGAQPVGPLAVSGSLLYGVTKAGGAGGFGVIFETSTSGSWRSLGEFTGTAGARPGANPAGGIFLNTDGLLYGTTEFGGTGGFGVIFKTTTAITPVFTVMRQCTDPTGSKPAGALVRGSDGQLYGTTANGGTNGFGTAYKITTAGVFTQLTHFTGETGASPGASMRGGLTVSGSLFCGVTSAGGAGNLGAAFQVSSTGTYTSLGGLSPATGWMPSGAPAAFGSNAFLFPVAAGGANGGGALMKVTTSGALSLESALGGTLGTAADGALISSGVDYFGVTAKGGASARGTLFRHTPGSGTALVSAYTTSGGSLSEGPMLPGVDGLYYGVSREGGASTRGTIYKITGTGTRTRLVSFTGAAGAAPGAKPRGALALAEDGNSYGLAEEGGASNTGLIFRLTAGGVYSVVSEFGATGPRSPLGGFVAGTDGFLYATTSLGGAAEAGAMIRFDPGSGTWETLGEFTGVTGGIPGEMPAGELHVTPEGVVYGTTLLGGADDEGTVFRFSEAGGLRSLVAFSGISGSTPGSAGGSDGAGLILSGGVAQAPDGKLYGTAPSGGTHGGGVAYRITPPPLIEDWKLAHLGDANAPDLGDDDGDGLANLVEYALLGTPTVADAAALTTVAVTPFLDGSFLSIHLQRDPARGDVTVLVEVSEDLVSWTTLATSNAGAPFSGPGYDSGDSASPGLKNVIIRDIQPSSSAVRRFLRVKVVR